MSAAQQCFIVEAKAPLTHTIILLHGRGSTGEEFAKDLFECEVTDPKDSKSCITLQERFPSCRWIFPTAKPRYSTVFQEEMTEWFDIYSLTDPEQRNELQRPGLLESLQSITDLIQTQDMDTNKLIIGGISQGFATAATFIMALDFRCAGFIGLSGWLPFASDIQRAVKDADGQESTMRAAQHATAAVRQMLDQHTKYETTALSSGNWHQNPIFVGHEQHDTVVAMELGETAREVFEACGANPSWYSYDSGDHWIKEPGEFNDLVRFLDRCIGNGENQA